MSEELLDRDEMRENANLWLWNAEYHPSPNAIRALARDVLKLLDENAQLRRDFEGARAVLRLTAR